MFTKKYRPKTFSEVIGQDLACSILKSLAHSPDRAIKSLILHGAFGCGKTTTARIFSRALHCTEFQNSKASYKNKDVCLTCKPCSDYDTLYTNPSGAIISNYVEYDSSVMGSKSDIEGMKDIFDISTNDYRVIVFDEAHLISSAGQSSLLKYIEEGPKNTFFIFASTDPDKLLPTIASRSQSIEFHVVDVEIIVAKLKEIVSLEGYEPLSDDLLYKIALKSSGHMRDALMTLDLYLLAKDPNVVKLPLNDIKNFFAYIQDNARDQVDLTIAAIMKYPLKEIKRTLFFVISKIVETYTLKRKNDYTDLANLYEHNIFKLLKFISEPWVQEALCDDSLTFSLFLTLATAMRIKK